MSIFDNDDDDNDHLDIETTISSHHEDRGQQEHDSTEALRNLYTSLSEQASRLLSELTLFQQHLSATSPGRDIFLARFSREVHREADVLERYNYINDINTKTDTCRRDAPKTPSSPAGFHNIRSSNVTSYVAIWEEAKRASAVVALKKKVKYYYPRRPNPNSTRSGLREEITRVGKRGKKETVMVDIVADQGRKWIKVWTKSQHWLLMGMAKEGLVGLDLDERSDQEDEFVDCSSGRDITIKTCPSHQRDLDDFRDLKLVKMACEFVAAAQTVRIGHQHPKVQFVLPKIYRGRSKDLDIVLGVIERMGIIVSCSGEGNSDHEFPQLNPIQYFNRMLTEPKAGLYPNEDVLNLDCTVLIALISDISHCKLNSDQVSDGVKIPAHYHGQTKCDIVDQFCSDQHRPLLPCDVYPVLSGKRLVCTNVAANHLKKIVHMMGTKTEIRRTEILLGTSTFDELAPEWNRMSIHPVDDDIQLPVEVMTFDINQALLEFQQQFQCNSSKLDFKIAERVANLEAKQLSDLNKAVFIYGWCSRIPTFTLNRVVTGFISRAIDDFLDELEAEGSSGSDVDDISFRGPRIQVCARERSLIGSEKTCRK